MVVSESATSVRIRSSARSADRSSATAHGSVPHGFTLRLPVGGESSPLKPRITFMTYLAAADRYDSMTYRRSGRSGLRLPAVSLGLWHNFGDTYTLDNQRAMLRRAFDRGVTHFDLANNYGPPLRLGRGELRPAPARRPPAVPRRADHLHQGRLRHVAGPVRRMGLAQVPAGLPGPVADPDGPGLRRHLLQPPLRPGHPARGDDGRARHSRALRQGAVRGHLATTTRSRPAGRRTSCANSAPRC